jgi:putative RNA 2'-phosphotransferase
MIDYWALSKTVSHALRHEPWLYELELDDEGWVPLQQLLMSLRSASKHGLVVTEAVLEEMCRTSSKRRHEIRDGRIRAIYGHSIPGKLKRTPAPPPAILFHGTSPDSVASIMARGLLPMNRQYVHLSIDEATSVEVGKRKARKPKLLRVRAMEAFESGVRFYEGNEKVWLADDVPPQFIAGF